MPPSLDIGATISQQLPIDLFTDSETSVFRLWLQALGDRLGDAIDSSESVRDNLFVKTATWNLTYWEEVLQLGDAGALTDAERRIRILNAMIGFGISIAAMQRRVELLTGTPPLIVEWLQRAARWGEATWGRSMWSDPAWMYTFEVIVCGYKTQLCGMGASESWSGGSAATSPLVLPYGSRVLTSSGGTATATLTLNPALDLTSYAVGGAAAASDLLLLYAAADTPANVTRLTLTLRTSLGSDTDSASHDFTIPGSNFQRLSAARSTFTETGAFSWANVRQLVLTLETPAATSATVILDEVWQVRPTTPVSYDLSDLTAAVNKHKPAGTVAIVTTL